MVTSVDGGAEPVTASTEASDAACVLATARPGPAPTGLENVIVVVDAAALHER
jgi:hypothetical protein